jgi:hypothetical protein
LLGATGYPDTHAFGRMSGKIGRRQLPNEARRSKKRYVEVAVFSQWRLTLALHGFSSPFGAEAEANKLPGIGLTLSRPRSHTVRRLPDEPRTRRDGRGANPYGDTLTVPFIPG